MRITEDHSTESLLWNAIEALAEAINRRNHTQGHSTRVAWYAVQIAEAAGYSANHLQEIRLGALFHDIGQIFWPDDLLRKQGDPLTKGEQKIIESHTSRGLELIQDWPCLEMLQPYILYHQEWIDGSGYPYGIRGDVLPAKVQIVSLADVYEALRHSRTYRKRPGYSHIEATSRMYPMRGKRWHANLFDLFLSTSHQWINTLESIGEA